MAVGCSFSMDSRGTLGNGLCWAKWLQETQILLLSDKKQHIFPFHIFSHLLMTEKGGKCHLWWFLQGIGFHGVLRMWVRPVNTLSSVRHRSHDPACHMTWESSCRKKQDYCFHLLSLPWSFVSLISSTCKTCWNMPVMSHATFDFHWLTCIEALIKAINTQN